MVADIFSNLAPLPPNYFSAATTLYLTDSSFIFNNV